MKRVIAILAGLFAVAGVAAQQPELVYPKYQGGADEKYFMTRITAEFEKIAVEKKVDADSLTAQVAVGFLIGKDGVLSEWRFLDNTCEGKDRIELAPATQLTRELLTEALGRTEAWTAAERGGVPVNFTWRLRLRLPVEKISKQVDGDPLKFMGGDPDKTFHEWAKLRVRYDDRFTAKGVEGLIDVRFFVEPDGMITIAEVVQSPSEKLTHEVVRVINNSRGKWTPRKKDGVPLRTEYRYRVNYHNN